MATALPLTFTSCSSDDDNDPTTPPTPTEESVITADETLYSQWVADDLYLSAARLVANWGGQTTPEIDDLLEEEDYTPAEDYGEAFINAGKAGNSKYPTVLSATATIIAGCRDILDEVAHSKIGAPYDGSDVNYIESPHSYNSIQDFYDNTLGCLYALNGAMGATEPQANSLMRYALTTYPSEASAVQSAFSNALSKIKAMKAPFAKYYSDKSAGEAIAALEALDGALKRLSSKLTEADNEATLAAINKNYVENVVRPTYENLLKETTVLQQLLNSLDSQATLDKACQSWKEARKYWEWSEAFLFGPAHNYGIDPHIDTWPFDLAAFNRYIRNNAPLTNETNATIVKDAIRNGQNLTGFHALEYLIFRNGKNRTVNAK